MKITLTKTEIQRALKYVKALNQSGTKRDQEDTRVIFTCQDNKTFITIDTLNNTAQLAVPFQSDCNGAINVPALNLTKFMRLAKSGPIEISSQDPITPDGMCQFSQNGFTMPVKNVAINSDPIPKGDKLFTIDNPTEFGTAVSRAAVCCGHRHVKMELNYLYLIPQNNGVRLVATNTSFMSVIDHSTAQPPAPWDKRGLIIPDYNALIELTKEGSPIDFFYNETEKALTLITHKTEIVIRLCQGVYPDYTKIIPESLSTGTTLPSTLLQSAVEAIPQNKDIHPLLSFNGNTLTSHAVITTDEQETLSQVSEITIPNAIQPIHIAAAPLLLSCIKALPPGTAEIASNEPNDDGFANTTSWIRMADKGISFLFMPMRVEQEIINQLNGA